MMNDLTPENVSFFKSNGYLIIRDLLSQSETQDLQRWAQEVHDWEPTADSIFMPYEVGKHSFRLGQNV
jgi:hypothetical protein